MLLDGGAMEPGIGIGYEVSPRVIAVFDPSNKSHRSTAVLSLLALPAVFVVLALVAAGVIVLGFALVVLWAVRGALLLLHAVRGRHGSP